MNKTRYNSVTDASDRLSALLKALQKAEGNVGNIINDLEAIYGEEQDAFDNMPLGLQNSEKGDIASQNTQSLGSAQEAASEVSRSLAEMIGRVNDAISELYDVQV